jgi:uncharacterized protein YjiS (DUF1127 family)
MWKKLEAWFERYGRHRAASAVVDVLSRMSDRELKDMGITRGEIREYAYSGSKKGS